MILLAMAMIVGAPVIDGLPTSPFELMQYRLRSEIIAPDDLAVANPFPDRPNAGVIGLGAFTHYERGADNISYGGVLVFVGPSTGLADFQDWAHDKIGIQGPTAAATQLGNKIYPTVQGAPITGHLLTNVRHSDDRSFGFMMGGDVAYVGDSKLLPESRGYEARKIRPRARAGFLYEGENAGVSLVLRGWAKNFKARPTAKLLDC